MTSSRTILLSFLFVLLVTFVPLAHAATDVGGGSTPPSVQDAGTGSTPPSQGSQGGDGQDITLVNPLGAGTDLPTLIKDILQFVVNIGAVVVVFMLVYVGFLFVMAQGNEGKLTQARTSLMWTIVGALILLGAQAIAAGIQATVNNLSMVTIFFT